MIYEPAEDTFFLKRHLENLELKGKKILEMGAGKGLVASEAIERGAKVTVSDLDSETLDYLQKNLRDDIKIVKSDLFENIDGRFDYIFFNPPYLPGVRRKNSDALIGGLEGTELAEKFLEEAPTYLMDGGVAYVVLSSRTDVSTVRDRFDVEVIDTRKLWFETLYLLKTG